jgi:chromosome segregation ATPase
MMFDAIKGIGGKKPQKSYEELEALVNAAREEQSALNAMLNQLTGESTRLAEVGEALQKLDAKAGSATASTSALEKRLQELEQRAAALGELEERVQALLAATSSAQRQIEKLTAPDGDLNQHRRQTRELSAEVAETRASVEAIAGERATFEELRLQLHHSSVELIGIKEAVDLGTSLRGDLERLRSTATELTRDVDAIREASREADDNAFSAGEAVKEMERRLGQMEALRELSDTIEEKLGSLTTLAEQVDQKVHAVDAQKQIIDRAVLDTNRLNEIVGKMASHISKLDGWLSHTERTEERLTRLDQLVAETAAKLDVTAAVSDEFRTSFQELLTQADELAKKQAGLEALREQLAEVEEISARASADIEGFRRSRADLDELQNAVHDFHHAYTGAAQLRDKLTDDRKALEAFDDRLSSFRARSSELEKTMETILAGMGRIDEGLHNANRLSELSSELYDRLQRVGERVEFVGSVEERLNALRDTASDIDGRLTSQLTRREELDTLTARFDDIVRQVAGAHETVNAVASVQDRMPSIETQLNVLNSRLDETNERIEQMQRAEEDLARQESRLAEFASASQALASGAAERMTAMYALIEELSRSSPAGGEVLDELARVEARQQEAIAQAESLEAKIAEFARRSEEIERALNRLAERDAAITAVGESAVAVESALEMPLVTEQHQEVAALRREMQQLMEVASVTEEQIAANAVQSKATLTALLEGVQANLKTVTDQKAMVDQLNGRLANVRFVIEEAHQTLRMLNQERVLVERIDESLRLLRAGKGETAPGGQRP